MPSLLLTPPRMPHNEVQQARERSLEALVSQHERKKLRYSPDSLNSSSRAVRAFVFLQDVAGEQVTYFFDDVV